MPSDSEADVFPWIGKLPVSEVAPPHLLQVMRRIEARGVLETAHRALQDCSQALRYAVAIGKTPSNPARDLKGALRRPMPRHFPAITDPARFGELLRAMDHYSATPVVRAALQLAPMLLLRPGELRFAEWPEINLDAAMWTVPALRDLFVLTGQGKMVFRGERHHDRAMSENTVNARPTR